MEITKENLFTYIKCKEPLLKEILDFDLDVNESRLFKKIIVVDCLFENFFKTKIYVDYNDFIENEK